MRKATETSSRSWLWLIVILVGLFWGCEEEPEMYHIYHQDEISRYLAETEEGRDLFRIDNLFAGDTFTIPLDDSAYYRILVDSVQRTMEFLVTPDSVLKDFDGLSLKRDAEVIIDDIFHTRTLRITPADTSETREARAVTRYAYFRKIGDDSRPYVGWKLYGYNPGSPKGAVRVTVRTEGGSEFPGDTVAWPYDRYRYLAHHTLPGGGEFTQWEESRYKYIELSGIANIGDGSRLVINTRGVANRSYYQLMSAATDGGWRNSVAHRPDSGHYLDTLKTPANNQRLWNLIFLQEYWRVRIPGGTGSDSMAVYSHGWCVPYRVPQ